METVIKRVVGDAAYKTEQEFNSVEDAYHDRNPITEVKATVTDIRVNNKTYRLKYEPKNADTNDNDNTVSDNTDASK